MENSQFQKKKQIAALCCGLLGCLCFGTGDWLMMYGDPTTLGGVYWLTAGVAQISPWRHTLAIALAFPGILLYGIALFAVERFILVKRQQRVYHILTVYGLTPWLCLHLYYILILSVFGWLHRNGYADAAGAVSEAILAQFAWLPLVSELLMIPPFLYWFYLQFSGKTMFPKAMVFTNILILYGAMYIVKSILPVSAFWLGFTNGLMSESMLLWFGILLVWTVRQASNPAHVRKE